MDKNYIKYEGLYTCRVGNSYRVKDNPYDDFALHHGSFGTEYQAIEWIKERKKSHE